MDKYEQLAYARSFIHRGAVVNYPENEVIFIKDFPNERWKVIPGFNGKYLISDMGNVYSTSKCKIMKKRLNQHGYYDIGLDLNNHNKTKRIHRLVAEAFVYNDDPINKTTVNHIDGDRSNNKANNLEWASYSENEKHAYDKLHRPINSAKLMKRRCESIDKNTNLHTVYESIESASRGTGVSVTQIRRIANNECNNKNFYFVIEGIND